MPGQLLTYKQQYFINVLRRPALRPLTKNSYLSMGLVVPLITTRSETAASPSPDPMSLSEPTRNTPQLPETIAPFRAKLYEESAKGLGEWRIWLSGRAEEDLRKRKKADASNFAIIMKKLR